MLKRARKTMLLCFSLKWLRSFSVPVIADYRLLLQDIAAYKKHREPKILVQLMGTDAVYIFEEPGCWLSTRRFTLGESNAYL